MLAVVSLGRDQVLGFSPGDWIELFDDAPFAGRPGELHQIDHHRRLQPHDHAHDPLGRTVGVQKGGAGSKKLATRDRPLGSVGDGL